MVHHLYQGFRCGVGKLCAPCDGIDGALNQLCGILGCHGALAGKASDFLGHHGESFSGFPCPCGLNGGVQSQDIGLEGDVFNGLDDLADFIGRTRNLFHGVHHVMHLVVADFGFATGSVGFGSGFHGIVGSALDLIGDIGDGGGKLFHGSRPDLLNGLESPHESLSSGRAHAGDPV